MDTQQRLEVLIQIARDYGLLKHMEQHREEHTRALDLNSQQVGADLSLVEAIVDGKGLYPVNYWMANWRAAQRLDLSSGGGDER